MSFDFHTLDLELCSIYLIPMGQKKWSTVKAAEGVPREGRGEIKHIVSGRPLQAAASALLQRGAVAKWQPVHPQGVPTAVLFPFQRLGWKVVRCGGGRRGLRDASVGGVRDERKKEEGWGGRRRLWRFVHEGEERDKDTSKMDKQLPFFLSDISKFKYKSDKQGFPLNVRSA